MKRLGLVLLCIAILVLFLARGDEPKEEEPAAPEPKRPIRIPGPPPKTLAQEALGIYMLETDTARIALELQAERKFRSISKLGEGEPRETTGTWSLAGRNLTLTYRTVGGEPIPDGPKYERCVYKANRIEMKVPGRTDPVVLRKASVIRHQ